MVYLYLFQLSELYWLNFVIFNERRSSLARRWIISPSRRRKMLHTTAKIPQTERLILLLVLLLLLLLVPVLVPVLVRDMEIIRF